MDVRSNLAFSGGAKITGLPASSANGEAVVHEQLASVLTGLAWKDNVRVATQSNTNLSSPGSTIDGISMSSGDRVLVRAQSTGAENGIYLWNGAASAMTRATDADSFDELESAVVTVDEGTSAGATYRQTAVNGTIDSSTVTWTTFGSSVGSATESSAGIAEIATQGETDTGTDDARFVTPLKLATYSGRAKRYAATFGDGSATQYDITHNLGTADVQVQVYVVATGVSVLCDVTRTSTTVVRLNFASAPASNTLRCVVVA